MTLPDLYYCAGCDARHEGNGCAYRSAKGAKAKGRQVPDDRAMLVVHAATAGADIVTRARKRAGALWQRLSGEGQLVECKAVLCDDMLRDRSGTCIEWWLAVQRAVLNLVIPNSRSDRKDSPP